MRGPVFGNEFFDQWLNQKSNEILAKVGKEKMSIEDMLILLLKNHMNHLHHRSISSFNKCSVSRKSISLLSKAINPSTG